MPEFTEYYAGLASGDIDGPALDPRYFSADDAPPRCGIYYDGTDGNYASTPDAAALDTTDLEVVMRVALADWSPAAMPTIAGKWGSGGQRTWKFMIATNGAPFIVYTTNGTTEVGSFATATLPAIGAVDGQALWLKFTFDANNGAAGHDVKFWWAADQVTEPSSWTQLGATVTTAGTFTLFNSTTAVTIGGTSNATDNTIGAISRAIVRDGIDGTVVADWRGDLPFGTRYRDVTGKVWTLTGSAWAWVADPFA